MIMCPLQTLFFWYLQNLFQPQLQKKAIERLEVHQIYDVGFQMGRTVKKNIKKPIPGSNKPWKIQSAHVTLYQCSLGCSVP